MNLTNKYTFMFIARSVQLENNSGYIRSFIAYKAQKLLIISKNTFINVIFV